MGFNTEDAKTVRDLAIKLQYRAFSIPILSFGKSYFCQDLVVESFEYLGAQTESENILGQTWNPEDAPKKKVKKMKAALQKGMIMKLRNPLAIKHIVWQEIMARKSTISVITVSSCTENQTEGPTII